MKKATIVSIILVLSGFSLMAQAGFRPGFIIKHNGDTLNGLVYYGTNNKFEKNCLFKRFEIAREVRYSAVQINAFGFRNGRYFESKVTGRKKVFLECLVKGEVSVYVKPGNYKGQVYIESKQAGLFSLAKGSNKIEGAGTFDNYREALAWVLNKVGNQEISLKDVEYDSEDIAYAVRESLSLFESTAKGFNQTPGVNYVKDNSVFKEGSLWKLGISGGYQFVTISTPGNTYSRYLGEADYNMSYRPAIGLYINHKLSRKSNLFSFDLSLHYTTDSYYGYSEYSDGLHYYRDDIMIDFSEIQVPFSLHLAFGKKSIHPFIKAGMYMSFLIDQSYSRLSEEQTGESIYTEFYADYSLGRESGYILGAGIEFEVGKARTISLEGGYSNGGQSLINQNEGKSTTLETSTFSIMARINL